MSESIVSSSSPRSPTGCISATEKETCGWEAVGENSLPDVFISSANERNVTGTTVFLI